MHECPAKALFYYQKRMERERRDIDINRVVNPRKRQIFARGGYCNACYLSPVKERHPYTVKGRKIGKDTYVTPVDGGRVKKV